MGGIPEGATQLTPFKWYKQMASLVRSHIEVVKSGVYDAPAPDSPQRIDRKEIFDHWISGAFLAIDLKTAIQTLAAALLMPLDPVVVLDPIAPAPLVNRVRSALDAFLGAEPTSPDQRRVGALEKTMNAFTEFGPHVGAGKSDEELAELLKVFKEVAEQGHELHIAFEEYLAEFSAAIRSQADGVGSVGVIEHASSPAIPPVITSAPMLTMEELQDAIAEAMAKGCRVVAVNPDLVTAAHTEALTAVGFQVVVSRVHSSAVVFSVS